MIASSGRTGVRGVADPAEIALVVAAALVAWRLVMGWDWSVVPAGTPDDYRDPHGWPDWTLVYLVAMACVGWLALRGRPVLGPFAVVLPLVVFAGSRMAAAEVIGANLWPIGLAVIIVTLGMLCAGSAVVGTLLRRHYLAGTPSGPGTSGHV
jgi:hypothetical protein